MHTHTPFTLSSTHVDMLTASFATTLFSRILGGDIIPRTIISLSGSFQYIENYDHNTQWHSCISFNSKSAHGNRPIFMYMQKEDSLSFPTLLGSGGCGLSLLNEICANAKCLKWWFYGVLMWFEKCVRCDLKLMSVTIPMYFSTIAKTIRCCDKLWFLGVSIETRCDLQRSIVIHLNLAIYCKSWWYTLQMFLHIDSVQTI